MQGYRLPSLEQVRPLPVLQHALVLRMCTRWRGLCASISCVDITRLDLHDFDCFCCLGAVYRSAWNLICVRWSDFCRCYCFFSPSGTWVVVFNTRPPS